MRLLVVAHITAGHRIFFLSSIIKELRREGVEVIIAGSPEWQSIFPDICVVSQTFFSQPSLRQGYTNWLYIHRIAQECRKNEAKLSGIFFLDLDDFVVNYLHPALLLSLSIPKWSGIFLHPKYLRLLDVDDNPSISDRDIVLTSNSCKAIITFDQYLTSKFQQRFNKLSFRIPDIANLDYTDNSKYSLLIEKSKEGRIVVGLVGNISKRKSIFTFLELAKIASKKKFLFVIAGTLTNEYTINEKRTILESVNSNSHIIWINEYIQNESELNTIIKSLDIVFIFYKNFYSSSNFLTKAVYFGKLVLCRKLGYIYEMVCSYKLGEGSDDEPQSLLIALNKLADNVQYSCQESDKRDAFIDFNSYDKFKLFTNSLIKLYV